MNRELSSGVRTAVCSQPSDRGRLKEEEEDLLLPYNNVMMQIVEEPITGRPIMLVIALCCKLAIMIVKMAVQV